MLIKTLWNKLNLNTVFANISETTVPYIRLIPLDHATYGVKVNSGDRKNNCWRVCANWFSLWWAAFSKAYSARNCFLQCWISSIHGYNNGPYWLYMFSSILMMTLWSKIAAIYMYFNYSMLSHCNVVKNTCLHKWQPFFLERTPSGTIYLTLTIINPVNNHIYRLYIIYIWWGVMFES